MNLTAELIKYSEGVLKDKPLSCQKHKWACLRFLNDLKRSAKKDKSFPYYFDEQKAARFLAWMALFKHRKGKLKGQRIDPAMIQKFIFGNVYGWIHRETGYRRFNKMYWQVGRKNAKSQSLALVGLYELMALDVDGSEVSEVYCAATKTEQARIVWDEAESMLAQSEFFKGKHKYEVAYNRIKHIKTGSIMRALSKEDRKTGDGLNPQCGIIDEYHGHETSEIYDIIDSGMGARTQPLLAIITTAGFNLDHPCYRVEYDLVSKILNPDVRLEMENYFVMINELDKNHETGELIDDIKNPDVWGKANPILCSYHEGISYIKNKLQEAVEAPEKMRNYLTKHMNIWMQIRESGYMNMARWDACPGLEKFPPLKRQVAYLGLDLSAKVDLTSGYLEFKIDGIYYGKSHSFMPEETVAAKEKTDKVPYRQWEKEGWITFTPGAVVDYRQVKQWYMDDAKKNGYHIEEWCIDPWGSVQISAELIEDGQTPVEIIQGIKTLSEPTKDYRNMVYSGKVVHDHSPVMSMAMSNAVVDCIDRNQNIILTKKKSRQRIDPVAAAINAHVRAMGAEDKNVYNRRGMRSLL